MKIQLTECAVCHEQYPSSLFDGTKPEWDAFHLGFETEIPLNHICRMCKTQSKTCSKCKKVFPAIALYFYRRPKGKYGLYCQCIPCRIAASKAEYRRHREKRLVQMKARYQRKKGEREKLGYNLRKTSHPLIRESDND